MKPFEPLFRNAHLATIAGNFWRRPSHGEHYPELNRLFRTEPEVQVLVHSQLPLGEARGALILVHGLEGSSQAGYARSLSFHALAAGYAVHRFNMRSCGGTEHLSRTNYHAGQTSDLLVVLKEMRRESRLPFYLIGFSLGGNVSLKLAGELGDNAAELLDGVCAVSTPLDLGRCVEALAKPSNFIYEWRFVSRLKQRIEYRHRQDPTRYPLEPLKRIRTVYEFDDQYTAPMFGFGNADNYYGTQSAKNFLDAIRIPALLVQAKDDPLIPFEVYRHPAFERNPHLRLIATEHGGHLGFLSARPPRFWVDEVVLHWVKEAGNKALPASVPSE